MTELAKARLEFCTPKRYNKGRYPNLGEPLPKPPGTQGAIVFSNRFTIFIGLLVFCAGCTPTVEEVVDSRSLPELAESVAAECEEFNFLLTEDAGTESYQACVSRIKATLDSVTDSLPNSGLDDARAEKLAAAVEDAKAAYETFATTVNNNSSPSQMAKANSKFREKSKAISEIFK